MARKRKPDPATPPPAPPPLEQTRKRPGRPKKTPESPGYKTHKERQAEISRRKNAENKEIGPLDLTCAHPQERDKARLDLRYFCERYFPARFSLAWSEDHLKAITKLQECVLDWGQYAYAMPRGTGKSSLAEATILWALLYGHRQFILLIGSEQEAAEESVDAIKTAIETEELLGEDFPEVCLPIRALEGINNRCAGQTYDGKRTRITWTQKELVLPSMPNADPVKAAAGKLSESSGSIFRAKGITARIRGMKVTLTTGEVIRPDFAILDDPQTDESAESITQTVKRERLVMGAVRGLSGPRRKISVIMPCTAIKPRDLAERFLDRDRHPEWQGERTQLLRSFPTNMELWQGEYNRLRVEGFKAGVGLAYATPFYQANRVAMDEGAEPSWAERYDPGEVSAIQFCMDLYLEDPAAFMAEYQNQPKEEVNASDIKKVNPEVFTQRLSGLPRFTAPRHASRLTAFIDVGIYLHWFALVAWDNQCGGTVIDYGAWPQQSRSHFSHDDPKPGLRDQYPNLVDPAVVYAGLVDLSSAILGRSYYRETGGELKVDRCLIDSGKFTREVYQFCRQSAYASIIYPSKGIARTQSARGVSEWKERPGERKGHHWRLTVSETGRGKMVQFDPDQWKTFTYDRIVTPPGASGGLFLFGEATPDGRASWQHEMIAEHCAAEQGEPTKLRGVTFDKWSILPHKPDNHLFDCVVGCAVAASAEGMVWSAASAAGQPEEVTSKPKALSLAELQRQKRAARA